MKSSSEIRTLFLEYFQDHGHRILPSSSLVPADDPTLLFTNAGMVQFKRRFLGERGGDYARAATVQKCLRAGGKHNDLEKVGLTPRHHTFFEMLGNFSFGDYFKSEAIRYAYEFTTRVLGLTGDRLWFTVHERDEEARGLWQKVAGVGPERVWGFGDAENFWAMGEAGPCGPCSEIFYDQGEASGCGRPTCGPNCECGRFVEFWNLVFMQYQRDETGGLLPLPRPSIDTGMGLERIAAILQGKPSNFQTDLFGPLLDAIEEHLGGPIADDEGRELVHVRVLADHARAVTCLLADGVYPSNEGRGYVLRRILRRAVRHYWRQGRRDPLLYRLADVVVAIMGDAYPELQERQSQIREATRAEEERFLETIEQGMSLLSTLIGQAKQKGEQVLSGEWVFRLFDEKGFPPDLTQLIAREEGLEVDLAGYERLMAGQRERSRAASRFEAGTEVREGEAIWRVLREGRSEFVGYERLEVETEILRYLRQGDRVKLVLAQTPFYAESGGQVGDRGWIRGEELEVEVLDCQKEDGEPVLEGRVVQGDLSGNGRVLAMVEAERRVDIQKNHTATHLLHAALRRILGDHVRQAGSLVAPERLRFDFTHFAPAGDRDLEDVESLVNEQIWENLPIQVSYMRLEEAKARGAMAYFIEKYGDLVRVVTIPGFSMELCGGTHTQTTGEIGLFKVKGEEGVAAGVRRVEALTGRWSYEQLKQWAALLQELEALLKAPAPEVARKVEKLIAERRRLEGELARLRQRSAALMVEEWVRTKAERVGRKTILAVRVDGYVNSLKEMRQLADLVRSAVRSGVGVLGAEVDGAAQLMAVVTPDVVAHGLSARSLIQELARALEGKGGGRDELAQAGGRRVDRLDDVLAQATEVVKARLKGRGR